MVASNNVQGIRINETEISYGHIIDFLLPVRSLVALKSKPLVLEYHCNCGNVPTSWKLSIAYEQEPETGRVLCNVSLNRIDSGIDFVVVSVTVSYLDKDDLYFRYSEIIGGEMFSGDETEGSFEDSRHPGYISYIFSLGLILKISLSIKNCHTAVKIYAKAGLTSDQIILSKL
ncbi:hypothetical protein HNY73_021827 [Argiope bruennichi]|uniref:Uncharacterized protein n=1 Tax=Argiope bruennichi TaxID=94029 RepID=A0A8T0E098_ARGBR|nr:hypothetical protein HNY73_021827 [Argiope bruennichi]